MSRVDKIIEDYKNAVQEKNKKRNEHLIRGNKDGYICKETIKQIESDFDEDIRKKSYDELMRQAELDNDLLQEIIDAQVIIFNQKNLC